MKRWWILGLVGVGALALAGWFLWTGDEETPEEPVEAPPEEGDDPRQDPFAALFEAAGDLPPEPLEGQQGASARERADWSPEKRREWRRERRQEWRERLRNMTPEERREHFRRRVDIVPMGDEDPGLEPEEVMRALRSTRPAVRECVQANGGFRAFRQAMRDNAPQDGGARRRMTMSFDLTADGTIPSEGIALDPAPPEPFYSCFADALAAAPMPQPQADARIELQFGGRGGGRRRPPDDRRPRPVEVRSPEGPGGGAEAPEGDRP